MNIAFFFEPKSDITAHELAVCMPYAARTVRPEAHNIEKMDQEIRRHFRCIYDPRDGEAKEWVEQYFADAIPTDA